MEAPAHILCPDCRARWQRYHDAQGRAIQHSPIGYCTLYIELDGQEVYHSTVRSYADLRATIATMETGTMFVIHLCIFLDIIGGGYYTKTEDGVQVRSESRAAEGLHLTMLEKQEG